MRCEDYCESFKELGLTACEGCCGRMDIPTKKWNMRSVKVRVTTSRMRKTFCDEDTRIIPKRDILLKSGAKGYFLGGGWWLISGYVSDGSDVSKALDDLL